MMPKREVNYQKSRSKTARNQGPREVKIKEYLGSYLSQNETNIGSRSGIFQTSKIHFFKQKPSNP